MTRWDLSTTVFLQPEILSLSKMPLFSLSKWKEIMQGWTRETILWEMSQISLKIVKIRQILRIFQIIGQKKAIKKWSIALGAV